MLVIFGLIVFVWIFFRVENINYVISYIFEIFFYLLFIELEFLKKCELLNIIILVIGFIIIEWFGRE